MVLGRVRTLSLRRKRLLFRCEIVSNVKLRGDFTSKAGKNGRLLFRCEIVSSVRPAVSTACRTRRKRKTSQLFQCFVKIGHRKNYFPLKLLRGELVALFCTIGRPGAQPFSEWLFPSLVGQTQISSRRRAQNQVKIQYMFPFKSGNH